MLTSFYSGLTGLASYSSALNVVGNNLANLNTTGFKGSDMTFNDMVSRTFGGIATNAAGNPMQVGLGTMSNSVSGIFTQGSIQSTQDPTNVAIEGNGFFVVGDTADSHYYTRDGNFFFDKSGNLINASGKYVLGYTTKDANNEIVASGALSQIAFPANTISAPQETSYMQIFANLNVRDATASTYSASATVYDSKGAPHTVTITFTHQTPSTVGTSTYDRWTYTASIPDADTATGTAGSGVLGSGTLFFDSTGTLYNWNSDVTVTTPAVPTNPPTNRSFTTPVFANGASALTFDWQMYQQNGANYTPILTGYPIPSSTTSTNTDGYAPGNLTSVVIDQDGVLQGVFSNGQVEELAQLAIAQFNNPKGLMRVGNNLFSETRGSGNPSIGAAGTGGRGSVMGSSVEASNVDMASEFTKMLVFERGYQANSKIITAADTLVQTAIGLVR